MAELSTIESLRNKLKTIDFVLSNMNARNKLFLILTFII